MTAVAGDLRVLFRVAAGPRLGFGHLVRARTLARALGVAGAEVSLRGPEHVRRVARAMGLVPVDGEPSVVLDMVHPDVLVVDDPSASHPRPWLHAARARRVTVVSVHDLGRGMSGADLVVDGSLVRAARWTGRRGVLAGPAYALLDPSLGRTPSRDREGVLIALGGGPRINVAERLALAIRRASPDTSVRIASGFAAGTPRTVDGVTWLGPVDGLAEELAGCAVAVTAGGVSMYEAATLRTPLVVWPVVDAQVPAARAFARHGLARVVPPGARRYERAAAEVARALQSDTPAAAPEVSRDLDGQGALRVAEAIVVLVHTRRQEAAA